MNAFRYKYEEQFSKKTTENTLADSVLSLKSKLNREATRRENERALNLNILSQGEIATLMSQRQMLNEIKMQAKQKTLLELSGNPNFIRQF